MFDNGKDYRSKLLNGEKVMAKTMLPDEIDSEVEVEFQGLFATVGSEVHFTRTYNGKSKGRQERYFRLIGEYLAKDIGSYVGSDSKGRPEEVATYWRNINGVSRRTDFPDWGYFCDALGAVIERINDSFTSNGSAMDGKTRSQVFAENLPEIVRRADPALLQKALQRGHIRQVRRNGVELGKTRYYSTELLAGWFGQNVRVYENLLDASRVMVCTLSGSYICDAAADYHKERGDLSETIGRVTLERKKLTALAVAGSSEVKIDPEKTLMWKVNEKAYNAVGTDDVDKFLGSDSEPMAGLPEKAKTQRKESKLISPWDVDPADWGFKEA